jgi:hypothetical protein
MNPNANNEHFNFFWLAQLITRLLPPPKWMLPRSTVFWLASWKTLLIGAAFLLLMEKLFYKSERKPFSGRTGRQHYVVITGQPKFAGRFWIRLGFRLVKNRFNGKARR